MNNKPAIVWFRRDLRLADNPALTAALDRGSNVLPVFIWAPEEEAPWEPGGASRWWLHQSLLKLDAGLRRSGSKLTIRHGPTLETMLRLVEETGTESVFWNRLYEPSAIARDASVMKDLGQRGITADSLPGNLLFEPWTVLKDDGTPYRVFSAFWKACMRRSPPPAPLAAPGRINGPANWPASLTIEELELEPKRDWACGLRETWLPGEAEATRQFSSFINEGIAAYPKERDRPDHPGTSRLSPYLHFGEITPRQIWHRAAIDSAGPYLRQVIWRDFAHHLLFHYPQTSLHPLRPEFERFPWQMNAKHMQAWTRGQTGYPLVDAGMRQLWHTGWVHNRVRMVAASLLVKHLLIPWQEGAAWFWDTLVDADLANNTLGWQWVAGCGADAAPYFRIFNPALQQQKFDPNGDYVRRWLPDIGNSPAPIVGHETARARALEAFARLRT